jgi:predicted PurR-regulated permease PerM
VGRSAMVGTMATAVVQGVLATVGYTFSDLPHAVTWGLLTAVASFFPMAGTALVWVPISLHFLSRGQLQMSVLQAVWGLAVVVGLGDYVLRPRLVGGSSGAQPLLTLVAALGGVEVFGLAGLVVGPVLMSLFVAILRIYEREMEADLADTRPVAPLARRSSDRTRVAPPVEPPDE